MSNVEEIIATGYTLSESARVIDRSPQRVDQLARAGQLDYVMTPLGRIFDRRSVERLADRQPRRRGRGPEAA